MLTRGSTASQGEGAEGAALRDGTQRAAAKALRTVLTSPRTVLKAMEFYAKLTGELGGSRWVSLVKTSGRASRPATIIWNTNYNQKKRPGVGSASNLAGNQSGKRARIKRERPA